MKYLFSIFAFLLFHTCYSQTDQTVVIKGYAPNYIGKDIRIAEIEDYISFTERTRANTIVQTDSTFTVTFLCSETKKIKLYADLNSSFLYVQPGGRYEIYVPEKSNYDPYRPLGNQIEVTIGNPDTNDINFKLLRFQRWEDEYISYYFPLKTSNPSEFAQKMDEFKTLVETYYHLNDTTIKRSEVETFFATYVRFSIASLDNIQHSAQRNRYEKHDFYLKFAPVSYSNDAYMTYFNAFYEKMTPRLTMETNNRVYLGLLKSSPTLIMKALGNEYTLINLRIRELVMIKSLSEEFYSKDFPQTNILAVLDSVAKHSLFKANGIIAANMMERLTQLVQGAKAPEFRFTSPNKDTLNLTSFEGKHTYLHFYDPSSQKNEQELEPLSKLYEAYKDDIQFVTIYLGDNPKKLSPLIKWDAYAVEKSNSLWKDYKVSNFSYYVLIDPYGYLVGAPALGPLPNGKYQTIENTFFFIKKTRKEQKD